MTNKCVAVGLDANVLDVNSKATANRSTIDCRLLVGMARDGLSRRRQGVPNRKKDTREDANVRNS